jgi:hypothetical protein
MRLDLGALLDRLIANAAERYGPRHRQDWLIAVVADRTKFAETILERSQSINVHVTKRASIDPQEATYELAHEAVHCIIASGRRDTIFFEEGLATHHALTLNALNRKFRKGAEATLTEVHAKPLFSFRRIIASIPTPEKQDDAIRTLRRRFPEIDQITPEAISQIFGVPLDLAQAVCRRMKPDRPSTM